MGLNIGGLRTFRAMPGGLGDIRFAGNASLNRNTSAAPFNTGGPTNDCFHSISGQQSLSTQQDGLLGILKYAIAFGHLLRKEEETK